MLFLGLEEETSLTLDLFGANAEETKKVQNDRSLPNHLLPPLTPPSPPPRPLNHFIKHMVSLIHHPHFAPLVLRRRASAASSPSPACFHRAKTPAAFPAAVASSSGSPLPTMSCLAFADGGGRGTGEREGPPSSLAMDFPYLSPSHRDLMVDLLSAVEGRLGPYLLPSSVPSDVLSFQNEPGTCKGALDIRSGADGSTVDFILESWLHCELPFGVLDITTLFAFLSAETDAPHLLMEFIQNGPNSLILFMDLLPRRDLVLHPDYLDHFYQQTPLDKARQDLENVPEVAPYRSSSLYIRSVLSPTAVAVNINCGLEGAKSMEEVIRDNVAAAAKHVIGVWLEKCACGKREVTESERAGLLERDNLIKNKTVEIDLASNLPRLFGQDVADRVVAAIQKAFRI